MAQHVGRATGSVNRGASRAGTHRFEALEHTKFRDMAAAAAAMVWGPPCLSPIR